MEAEVYTAQQYHTKCKDCGAFLYYKVGTTLLVCSHCNAANTIKTDNKKVVELKFDKHVKNLKENTPVQQIPLTKCNNCGARTTLQNGIVADKCLYCTSPLVIPQTGSVISPAALLPFKIEKEEANTNFSKWVNKLWFAPSSMKLNAKQAQEGLKGVYIPYWTYDCNAYTQYSGEKGIYGGNGDAIEWRYQSGNFVQKFDDILICASSGLPTDITTQLEPWDLENLVDYNEAFLSGFVSESYGINLEEGWNIAKEEINKIITEEVKRKIGGDRQKVKDVNIEHNKITFKHILLPLYLNTYKHKGKIYHFMINARTGEVQGQRPYSYSKIFFFASFITSIVIGAIIMIIKKYPDLPQKIAEYISVFIQFVLTLESD